VTLGTPLGSIDLNALVASTSGNILITGDGITQDADITTGGSGNVTVTAAKGSITMKDGSKTTGATGAITYTSPVNVNLSLLQSTSGAITITAGNGTLVGAITDNTAGETSNIITTGVVTMVAQTGIGAPDGADIDMTIGTLLQTTNKISGGVYLQNTNSSVPPVVPTPTPTPGGGGRRGGGTILSTSLTVSVAPAPEVPVTPVVVPEAPAPVVVPEVPAPVVPTTVPRASGRNLATRR
jgi:hypothetical protein